MNITIKKDQVNFTELIKTSNPETSLQFQSRMVQELSNEFDTDEQKWFVANLYMYINYHPTDDYPVNLDHVWKLIGFSTKANAKKKLKNNFTDGEDFKVLLFQMEDRKKGRGGQNEEKVMLNVDTFKNLCLMSATKQSKQIRKYYIKLENVYNKVVNQDYQTYQKTLESNQKQIENQQHQIKQISESRSKDKQNMLLREFANSGPLVYVVKVKQYESGEYVVKIGESRNGIEKRFSSHQSDYSKNIELLDCFAVCNSKKLESFIHGELRQFKARNCLIISCVYV